MNIQQLYNLDIKTVYINNIPFDIHRHKFEHNDNHGNKYYSYKYVGRHCDFVIDIYDDMEFQLINHEYHCVN